MSIALKVLEIREIRDCFDGSYSRDLLLSRPFSETEIRVLTTFFDSVYLDSLPRPFFRIAVENDFVVKGILGENMIEFNCRDASDTSRISRLMEILSGVLDDSN